MKDALDNTKILSPDMIGDLLTKQSDGPVMLAGRYKIVRKLGEGGMGSVWLAEDQKLDGRKVAIKMLPVVLATNARAIQQLKVEAKVAMQLSHANIVTLRSFEDSDEGAFLVMDYVPGKTLEQILAEKGTLTEEEVLKMFRPIAEALDHAHKQKVIHRDIKPSNILIREDGEPFIMDFGIAREMKDTMTRVTGKNSSGTLPYMSPEQLRGEEPAPAQDVYSLAATIYECLSGHPPFHRGQIEYQIANETPKPLTLHSPLARAVMAGLAKTPEGRPAKAGELLGGEGISPQRTQRGDGQKWVAGLILLAGLAAAGWFFLGRGGTLVHRSLDESGLHCPGSEDGGSGGPALPEQPRSVGGGSAPAGLDSETAPGSAPRATEQPTPAAEVPPEPAVDYETLVDMKATAEQRWAEVQALNPGQGFRETQNRIEIQVKAALDCFNDEKQRALAQKKYAALVAECGRLLASDKARDAAKKKRQDAEKAQDIAERAGADETSKVLWDHANQLMQSAEKIFESGQDFSTSETHWSSAERKYAEALLQAQTALKVREENASKHAKAIAETEEQTRLKHAREVAASLLSGLVAYYPLDGNANDCGPKNAHGTIHGAQPAQDRHGRDNSCLVFDGNASYVAIPDGMISGSPSGFTVSAWAFPQRGNGTVLTLGGSSTGHFILSADTKAAGFNVMLSNTGWTNVYSLMPNASWTHITGVYRPGRIDLYINAKHVKGQDIPVSKLVTPSEIKCEIGSYFNQYLSPSRKDYFEGKIDELCIFNRALSVGEIQCIYEYSNLLSMR